MRQASFWESEGSAINRRAPSLEARYTKAAEGARALLPGTTVHKAEGVLESMNHEESLFSKTSPRTRMPDEGMSKTKRNFLRVASAKCIAFCRPFLCDAMPCHLISPNTSSLVAASTYHCVPRIIRWKLTSTN